MQVGQARYLHGFQLRSTLHQDQAHPLETLKQPAQGRTLGGLVELVGDRGSSLGQALTDAVLRQPIDEQAKDHDEPGCHHPLDLGR